MFESSMCEAERHGFAYYQYRTSLGVFAFLAPRIIEKFGCRTSQRSSPLPGLVLDSLRPRPPRWPRKIYNHARMQARTYARTHTTVGQTDVLGDVGAPPHSLRVRLWQKGPLKDGNTNYSVLMRRACSSIHAASKSKIQACQVDSDPSAWTTNYHLPIIAFPYFRPKQPGKRSER